MSSLRLDLSGNLIFGSSFFVIDGNDALAQDMRCLLRTFKGEYPFDTDYGIDYLGSFSSINNQLLKNQILDAVQADQRVRSAEITSFRIDNGKMSVALKILTEEGEVYV